LGLNLALPEAARAAIHSPLATPVTDLATACGGRPPPRLDTATCVAGRMLAGLTEFSRSGFASFSGDWTDFDSLRDAPVTVLRHDGTMAGIARGADAEGALRVEIPGGVIERVHAGDVSLRRSVPAEAMAR
jgi:BirA family biotin operon repressor/biotin-[acetyl-CoA-carboxylase] ligase